MYKRSHHQCIATLLDALNASLLLEHRCYFGGGTAIALRYGEYRESVDVDFLVSDRARYRDLRQLLTAKASIDPLMQGGGQLIAQAADLRADQYGIRTSVEVAGVLVKLEIVLEGRVTLDTPGKTDKVCGIATLTALDLVTSKLLANSDRWSDDGVFSRDLIDLAMMSPSRPLLHEGFGKAESAYGDAIGRDLGKAIAAARDRDGWLERCAAALKMEIPRALLWQHIHQLRRRAFGG